MESQNPQVTNNNFATKARSIWEDFGPFIVGILVLLLVLGGVWYLWSKRAQVSNDTATVIEETTGGTVPLSTLSFSGTPTPTPTIAPSPKPTPGPKVVNVESSTSGSTKGELPKTGFAENLFAAVSILITGAGVYLRKFAKKLA